MSVKNSLINLGTATAPPDRKGNNFNIPKILIVLVLYQIEIKDSISLSSLNQALALLDHKNLFFLIIYDNSPIKASSLDQFAIPFKYFHDPKNGGLFRAYAAGLQWAEECGFDWLLLLDQDTQLNEHFLQTVCNTLPLVAQNERCAVLVPKLLSKNKIISPARVLWGGRLLPVHKALVGFPPWEVTALNSGILLKCAAVRKVGGFNFSFWLDYLDHWLFNQLHKANYKVYVLDSNLQHALSVNNMETMSVERYRNILLAEGRFYRDCKSKVENIYYRLKLFTRILKTVAIPHRHRFLLPTLQQLSISMSKNRLTDS